MIKWLIDDTASKIKKLGKNVPRGIDNQSPDCSMTILLQKSEFRVPRG